MDSSEVFLIICQINTLILTRRKTACTASEPQGGCCGESLREGGLGMSRREARAS